MDAVPPAAALTDPDDLPPVPAPFGPDRAEAGVLCGLAAAAVVLFGWLGAAGPPAVERDIACRLDVNAAPVSELVLLEGVGPVLASRIAAGRGPDPARPTYRAAPDLLAVRGIGPVTLAKIEPHLAFPPPAGPAAPGGRAVAAR